MRRWVLFLLLLTSPAWATTYYVDVTAGSDADAGTCGAPPDCSGLAWQTLPGTRNTNNEGYLRTTWGAIDGTPKILCGDTILLKCDNSVYTSAVGGAWRIDPTFYTDGCTQATPITIRCATNAEWTGSSGHFTMDGTNITLTSWWYGRDKTCKTVANINSACTSSAQCGGGVCNGLCTTSGGQCGLWDVGSVDWVSIRGLSDTQRIKLRNVRVDTGSGHAKSGFNIVGGGGEGVAGFVGVELGWVEVSQKVASGGAAVEFSLVGRSVLHDFYIHDWPGPGVDTGASGNLSTGDILVMNGTVETTGPPSGTGGSNFTNDAVSFAGTTFQDTFPNGGGVILYNVNVAHNYWNGANSGGCNTWGKDAPVRYIGNRWYHNGRTADQASARVNIESGGDSAACYGGTGPALPDPGIWIIQNIFFNPFNVHVGDPHGGAGSQHAFNNIFMRAANTGMVIHDATSGIVDYWGNIFDTGLGTSTVHSRGNSNDPFQGRYTIRSDFNIYHGGGPTSSFSIWTAKCSPDGGLSFPGDRFCRTNSQCLGTESCRMQQSGGANFTQAAANITNPATAPGFVGANDRIGTGATFGNLFTSYGCDPVGATFDTRNFNLCDFTPLTDTSPQVDAGVFVLRTTATSASSVTSFSVQASTPEPPQVGSGQVGYLNWSPPARPHIADPRMYFAATNSWAYPSPDFLNIIQIEGATCSPNNLGDVRRARVCSMTSSAITIGDGAGACADYSCSWTGGTKGVHYQFTGSAPDAGGVERNAPAIATTTSTSSTTSSTSAATSTTTTSSSSTTSSSTTSSSSSTVVTTSTSTTFQRDGWRMEGTFILEGRYMID